jgi:hypothetical protein
LVDVLSFRGPWRWLHLDRVFEMLAPGNEFHREQLPGLLESARAATVINREQWAQTEAWENDAEKAVSDAPRTTSRTYLSSGNRAHRIQRFSVLIRPPIRNNDFG